MVVVVNGTLVNVNVTRKSPPAFCALDLHSVLPIFSYSQRVPHLGGAPASVDAARGRAARQRSGKNKSAWMIWSAKAASLPTPVLSALKNRLRPWLQQPASRALPGPNKPLWLAEASATRV